MKTASTQVLVLPILPLKEFRTGVPQKIGVYAILSGAIIFTVTWAGVLIWFAGHMAHAGN